LRLRRHPKQHLRRQEGHRSVQILLRVESPRLHLPIRGRRPHRRHRSGIASGIEAGLRLLIAGHLCALLLHHQLLIIVLGAGELITPAVLLRGPHRLHAKQSTLPQRLRSVAPGCEHCEARGQ
jgi:hypothetical protein